MKEGDKIYSLLGFAARMRKLVFGKERIRAYMRSGRSEKMVIVASDASERLKFDLTLRAKKTGTKLIFMFEKRELGKLLGKDEISAVGIEDGDIISGVERAMGR